MKNEINKSHEQINPDNSSESSAARRNTLKKIVFGGTVATGASAIPTQWAKPIVEKVIIPAHAITSPSPTTTSIPPECGCQTSPPIIDVNANSFSFSYSYSDCTETTGHKLEISGPGIDAEGLGYVTPTTSSSGSRSFQDTIPYNASIFQSGSTYTFTVTVFSGPCCVNVTPISTCVASVNT